VNNPVSVTYVGPLASGYVQCPQSGRHYPFVRGVAFQLPEPLAIAASFQSPEEWETPDSIRKQVEEKNAAEKAAREAQTPDPNSAEAVLKAFNEARAKGAPAQE
jgi:hypothetical protein